MDSFQPATRPLAEFAMRNSPLLSLCTCGNGAIEMPVCVSTRSLGLRIANPAKAAAGRLAASLGGVQAWWKKVSRVWVGFTHGGESLSSKPGWGGPLATAPLALSFGRAGESLKSDWWFCLKVCKNCIFAVVSRKFYKWKSRNYIKSLFLAACFRFCTEK